jgi:hypothetical protein
MRILNRVVVAGALVVPMGWCLGHRRGRFRDGQVSAVDLIAA